MTVFCWFQDEKGRCFYCHQKKRTAIAVIRHCISQHPSKEVRLLWPSITNPRVRYKTPKFLIHIQTSSVETQSEPGNDNGFISFTHPNDRLFPTVTKITLLEEKSDVMEYNVASKPNKIHLDVLNKPHEKNNANIKTQRKVYVRGQ